MYLLGFNKSYMSTMKSNNNTIYFEEHGQGHPLVLIAGLASDSQSWLPLIPVLAGHFRVITFDNRGIGRSSPDNTDISIEDMADDCARLIKHLDLPSANVLGHSMGGMIAMDLAARYPEMVGKLILLATTPKINRRNIELFNDLVCSLKSGMDRHLWFRNLFYWILSPSFFEDKEMLEQAVKMAIDYPYPQSDISFENQVRAISKFNSISGISGIQSPTLIVNGENDILFPFSETAGLFKNLSRSQTITITKSAHSIPIENPKGLSKSVIGFLTSNL
ncbi:MAG: alpha/beta hydrolase [Bacteroidetes bacterium]|nr:MAG: alpha/beta hydrolase [Bacteroidota bacterium]